MAKSKTPPHPKKRKKKKPANRKQTVISVLIILAVIAFVLPDIMPLFMSSGSKTTTRTSSNLPSNPAQPNAEPKFEKEGEVTLLDEENEQPIKAIDVEIADDDAQRAKGLMYRRSMKDEQGMLFLFDQPGPQSFYMRNTLIPLDIIFVDEDKRILNIHRNTTPLSEVSLPSEGFAQYVLEVNGGWCERHGVDVGDVLEW